MNEPFDFSINEWFPNDHPLSPEEEFILLQEIENEEKEESAARLEEEWFSTCCGSCSNFISIMAEAGLCKLNKNNCICKNSKSIIDMFDEKCEKWIQES